MTDLLAVGTGEQVALPSLLATGWGASARGPERAAPRCDSRAARHEPGAGVISMDRHSPLRERMMSLRGNRLLLLGILAVPLVMAGYVGLTVLLFLPLLGLRMIFRRRSTPAVVRWDGDAPGYSDVGNAWDAAARRA